MNLKDKTVCVIDTGNWFPVALKLAESFGKTYYYHPSSENGYMKLKEDVVGDGYEKEGVECLDEEEFWAEINTIDLFVFTDCVYVGLQKYLKSIGKLVWGSGNTAWMEQDRFALRKWQKREGMPTPEYKTVVGVDNLKDIPDNTFIKTNNFVRGNMETLRHYDTARSKTRLADLNVEFGGFADKIQFMVENKIDGVEIGQDSFTVNGQFPKNTLYGIEIKDKAYYGEITTIDKLPKQLKYIQDKLGTVFSKEKTKGHWSNEVRIDKKGDAYLTDMTCRQPCPPYQLHLRMWKNFAECIYQGAQGILLEPIPIAKYGAIVMISSDFACDNWMSIKIPDENKQWIMLMNCCKIDSEDWVMPIYGFSEVGAVVGIGNTRQEAIDNCKKHAEGIKGDSIEIDVDYLDEAVEEFDKVKKE